MQRRTEIADIEATLKRQTWYLAPERYDALFFSPEFVSEPLTMAGRQIEEVVTEIDEVDAYFESLENKRTMTGAALFDAIGDQEGWI